MKSIARWCFQHRYIVLAVWVVLLVGTALLSRSVGTDYSNSFSAPGSQSETAANLLEHSGLHSQFGDDTIVFHTTGTTVTDPAVETKINSALDKVEKVSVVRATRSPYGALGAAQISPDQHTAYINLDLSKSDSSIVASDVQPILDAITPIRSSNLDVELGGLGFQTLKGSPFSGSIVIGLVAAAVVLFIAFGSLLATLIPLISAILGLGVATETNGLLSHLISINAIAPTVGALIGLGVGIDYALFIVTRYRSGLRTGLSSEQATVAALNTSGRAVLFAGATVIVAMLGLLVLGVEFLSGVGIAAAVTVFFAVATAVTLLPAVFGMFGVRVLSRRERRKMQNYIVVPEVPEPVGGWARWAKFVERHPVMLSGVAVIIMAVLIVPAFSIRLGSTDQGNDPASSTTRKAYDLIASGFGAGHNGPLQLVAKVPTATERLTLTNLVAKLQSTPGVAAAVAAPIQPGNDIAIVQVVPTSSPQSAETTALVDRLRTSVIPSAEQGTSLRVYVGGEAATFIDFADVLGGKLPLFILVIILLGAILLMFAFRSLVVPLTAAVMNLLSAGAAFGVIVAVFQWGWLLKAIGLGTPGPIDSFLPVMMIAILFGLSMDYQVFLVSRMHEEWQRTGDNRRAVRVGQALTGRVISAAALIMIFVFFAFVLAGKRQIGEFGLGLSSAVLVDALVIRTVLVPAIMQVFGKANWWLPKWLDRILPHVSIEAPDEKLESAAALAEPVPAA
jgi:RND superfamily putative drug exporter